MLTHPKQGRTDTLMKLTCVTATYNCIAAGNRERLVRCVESIAALKTEHEHLVYDGASTDGTAELLRTLEARTPGLKVVSEPDTGLYNALNKGVRDAKGEWFYVLGSDDYICSPEILDSIIENESQETEIVATTVKTETSDGRDSIMLFTDMRELKGFFYGCICCHQGELMKTRLVRELGEDVGCPGFDERYRISADRDMFLRAHLKAVPIHYIFNPFACFHRGGLADSGVKIYEKEDLECLARALSLDARAKTYFQQRRYLPLSTSARMLWHRDFAVRSAARHMAKCWCVNHVKRAMMSLVRHPMTFCLTFDDGMKAHATIAAPELERRGWRGAFNVPTAVIGGCGLDAAQLVDMGLEGHEDHLMDWDDVKSLIANGHEVYPHTRDHADLVDLERAGRFDEAERQIVEAKADFIAKTGVVPRFFCLPHNKCSARVAECVRKHGMEPFSCARLNFGEPGHMGYYGTITDYLTQEYRFGRRHVDIMIHGITREEGGWRPFEDTVAFCAFLDEIVALERKGMIRVVPYSKAHGGSGFFGRLKNFMLCVETKARRMVFKLRMKQ